MIADVQEEGLWEREGQGATYILMVYILLAKMPDFLVPCLRREGGISKEGDIR